MAGRAALVTGATRGIAADRAGPRAPGLVGGHLVPDGRAGGGGDPGRHRGRGGPGARAPGGSRRRRRGAGARRASGEAAWGRLDALVHAAGPYHEGPLLEETPDRWRETFRQNLDPLLFLAQAAAPGMQARRWGRILALGLETAHRLAAQPNVPPATLRRPACSSCCGRWPRSWLRTASRDAVSPGIETPGYPRPDLDALLEAHSRGAPGRSTTWSPPRASSCSRRGLGDGSEHPRERRLGRLTRGPPPAQGARRPRRATMTRARHLSVTRAGGVATVALTGRRSTRSISR